MTAAEHPGFRFSMLSELLNDAAQRAAIIEDCAQLVDREVKGKSGFSGVAIKGAYGVVKKVSPGIIRDAIGKLIGPFVQRLEPFVEGFAGMGAELQSEFAGRRAEIANALLGVTDDKIEGAQNATIKKAYAKLRPQAQKHVESAVPGVAAVLAKYI